MVPLQSYKDLPSIQEMFGLNETKKWRKKNWDIPDNTGKVAFQPETALLFARSKQSDY